MWVLESTGFKKSFLFNALKKKGGSPSWIRTNGHSINSRMLYH